MKTPTSGGPVVARVLPDADTPDPSRVRTKGARARRMFASVLMGLIVALLAFTGFAGSPQTATAGPIDSIKEAMCSYTEDAPNPKSADAAHALYGSDSPYKSISMGDHSVTAYEQYGLSGLFWSNYDIEIDGCVQNMFVGFLANQAFDVSNTLTSFTIATYSWATDGDLLDSFTDPLDCVVAGCDGSKGLKDTLFLTYLLPVIVLGAVWAAWNGLFKKRTMQTTQGIVWMFAATTFAMIFLAHPGVVADKSNEVVGDLTTTVTNGVTGISAATVGKADPCYLAPGEKNRGNRMAKCSMWKAMIYTPWVAGQFGTSTTTDLKGADAVIGNRSVNDLRLAQLDSHTLTTGESTEDNAATWETVRDAVMDTETAADPTVWQGNSNSHRLTVSLASLAASLCLGVLVIVISFSTVVLSVGMILLIMMAPVFLLAGIHPGFGRGIALKWLELLLGTMLKRVVLATVLAILVGMYQVILATAMPWMSQVALIIALGMGAVVFRKPLLDTLNVINLGGTNTGMEAGIEREAKKGLAATVGAATGGFAAGKAGGLDAVVPGAMKGGIAASRSGSPLRAASMGMGAGRRVGTRDRAADNREEREQDKQNPQPGGGKRARTGAGPVPTAARDELERARLEDAAAIGQQPGVDEILGRLDNGPGSGGDSRPTATPRPSDTDTGGGDTAQMPPIPAAPAAPSGAGVPRPVAAPTTREASPETGASTAPAQPVLPGAPGVPTAPPAASAPRPAGAPSARVAPGQPHTTAPTVGGAAAPAPAPAQAQAPVGLPVTPAPARTAPAAPPVTPAQPTPPPGNPPAPAVPGTVPIPTNEPHGTDRGTQAPPRPGR